MKNLFRVFVLLVLMTFFGCSSSTSPKPKLDPILGEFSGPLKCKKTEVAIFQAKGYDPDGEKVSYHFGFWLTDDVDSFPSYIDLGYTPYVENNTVVTKSITFTEAGEYTVCCHCIDETKKESVHKRWEIIVTD
jgi:hypothetical protein